MKSSPKYSLLEIERRWLVKPEVFQRLVEIQYRLIEDLYIIGSRVRLRKLTDLDGKNIFKLCKKYGKKSPISESITNLYLTLEEYQEFQKLPGLTVRKRRYPMLEGSIDLYVDPNRGLMIYEVEFENEQSAKMYEAPDIVVEEITGDHDFSGYMLARQRTA